MNYKIQPGITHVNICGVDLLFPVHSAAVDCPNAVRLGGMGSLLWGDVEGSLPRGMVISMLSKTQEKPRQAIKAQIDIDLRKLCEKGCLIEVSEKGEPHDER